MGKIVLSIIIPYYNTEKYTEELLDCLAPQITEETEVILIDDGSRIPFETGMISAESSDRKTREFQQQETEESQRQQVSISHSLILMTLFLSIMLKSSLKR